MTGVYNAYPRSYNAYPRSYKRLYIFQFSTYIFSADFTLEILKLCRATKVEVLFLVLVCVFNFDLFGFSAAILEKGLFLNGFKCRATAMPKATRTQDE